jgi:hypothetical protein
MLQHCQQVSTAAVQATTHQSLLTLRILLRPRCRGKQKRPAGGYCPNRLTDSPEVNYTASDNAYSGAGEPHGGKKSLLATGSQKGDKSNYPRFYLKARKGISPITHVSI